MTANKNLKRNDLQCIPSRLNLLHQTTRSVANGGRISGRKTSHRLKVCYLRSSSLPVYWPNNFAPLLVSSACCFLFIYSPENTLLTRRREMVAKKKYVYILFKGWR